MKIVILGASEYLGASITRFMIKFTKPKRLTLCSPTGEVPEGVFSRMEMHKVDIMNINELRKVCNEGDIVINGQLEISPFGKTLPLETIELHRTGLFNLLAVANEQKVEKVITYIPGILTWKSMNELINADTQFSSVDPKHINFIRVVELCKQYWNQEEMPKLEEILKENISDIEEKSSGGPSGGPISGSSLGAPIKRQSNLDLSKSAKSSNKQTAENRNESQQKVDIDIEAKKESTIEKERTIDEKTENDNIETTDEESEDNNTEITDESKKDNTKEDGDKKSIKIEKTEEPKDDSADKKETKEDDEEIPEKEKFKTQLAVLRGGIPFGPFEEVLTPYICKGVKVQRIVLRGTSDKKISWLHPDDLGKAIVDIANSDYEGQFFVKSFDASVIDIVRSMEKANASATEIVIKKRNFDRFKVFFKQKIKKEKVILKTDLGSIYIFESHLQIDDSDASNYLNWKPKFHIDKATKTTLEWFNRYIIASPNKRRG